MNGSLTEDHDSIRYSLVMTFLFAVAAGLLLAHVAFGYSGATESADSPALPSLSGRASATA